MLLQILQNSLILILISTICFGFFSLFWQQQYTKKIASLSVAYSSVILLLLIVAKNSDKAKDLYILLITILITFSITMICGIGIVANIIKLENKKNSYPE